MMGLLAFSLLSTLAACEVFLARRRTRVAWLAASERLERDLARSCAELVETDDRLRREAAEHLHGEVQSRLLMAWALMDQALDLASVQGARRLRVGLTGDRAQGLTLDIEAWGEGIDLARVRRSPGFALLDARVALMSGRWEMLIASDVRIRVCVVCPLSEPEAQLAIPRR